jgi:hypothetical protein
MKYFSNKIIIIGKGRFGNAIAQGFREGFIESEDGTRASCKVVQVSATSFTLLLVSEMAYKLQDTEFVIYCGTKLSEYARKMSLAIQLAITLSSDLPLSSPISPIQIQRLRKLTLLVQLISGLLLTPKPPKAGPRLSRSGRSLKLEASTHRG